MGDPFAGLGVKYHTDGVPTSSGSRLPVFFDNYEQGKGGAPCGLCWEVESSDLCDFCEDETPLTVLVGLPGAFSSFLLQQLRKHGRQLSVVNFYGWAVRNGRCGVLRLDGSSQS